MDFRLSSQKLGTYNCAEHRGPTQGTVLCAEQLPVPGLRLLVK